MAIQTSVFTALVLLGATVPVQQFVIKVSYNRFNQSGLNATGTSIDANDVNQYALGPDYNLSKRTAVYANAASLKNKGAANYSIPGGGSPMVAGGYSSRGYDVGIRHAF